MCLSLTFNFTLFDSSFKLYVWNQANFNQSMLIVCQCLNQPLVLWFQTGRNSPRMKDSPVIRLDEYKFCVKKHDQSAFYETTATNSLCIRAPNSILEAAILSLLVYILSCAWWERSVHFCLVPCSKCCQCDCVDWSTAHKPTTTVTDKQVSEFELSIETLSPT